MNDHLQLNPRYLTQWGPGDSVEHLFMVSGNLADGEEIQAQISLCGSK